ncbi:unnamed protein product, partial [Didymodactylos carnosus]
VTRELFPMPSNIKISDKSLFSKVIAAIPRASFEKMLFKMQVEQRQIDMESSETILENIQILDCQAIIKRRHRDLVYEDNFNPTILDMAKNRVFTYSKLKKVCGQYESKRSLEEHIKRSDETASFFRGKGLSEDDARAVAFAIAFYTGSECGSDGNNQYRGINRASSVIARQSNGEAIANIDHGDMKDSAVILYYLIRGLAHIPFYWGVCSRAISLNEEQLSEYEPGALVSWFQFSSSMKGQNAPPHFVKRSNTFFKIYSATGRGIQDFSIFPKEEEILFLPHSTFLVVDHTLSFDGKKHVINLRQVELGLSEYTVLWVDDHIFSPKWHSKRHMESAATRSLNINIHFIPKSTTEFALSFLKSPFGQRLRNRVTFRIVTDMKRDNESSSDDAGIRLIKKLREMGFRNECLIFCNYLPKVTEQVKTQLTSDEQRHLAVTSKVEDLYQFIQFK